MTAHVLRAPRGAPSDGGAPRDSALRGAPSDGGASRDSAPPAAAASHRHTPGRHAARRLAGVLGLAGVAGNIAGVLALHDVPAAYRLARLDEWVRGVALHPAATTASALAFAAGLYGLAVWVEELGDEIATPPARFGARLASRTALANAAGSLLPLVLAVHVGASGAGAQAVGRGLLGAALSLDALFNLGLGAGLLLIGAQAPRGGVRALALLAGAASLPVSLQALWDPAASWLAVAAPLWLALVTWTSVAWIRSHARG